MVIAATLLVAVGLTWLMVRPSTWVAARLDVFDLPSPVKRNARVTPRLGGIAIVAGIGGGAALGYLVHCLGREAWSARGALQAASLAAAAGFVFLVGLVADVRTVSSGYKFAALLAAAGFVASSGLFEPPASDSATPATWLPVLSRIGMIGWIVVVAVAIDLIDGLDGLASGLVLLAASVLAATLLLGGHFAAAILPLAIAGSSLGFLFFNWHPARTAAGDCGSLTMGFLLGVSMALANGSVGFVGGTVLPSIALIIPITDAALTLVRRFLSPRRGLFTPGGGQIHHCLLGRGIRHHHAVMILLLVSVLAVVVGTLAILNGTGGGVAGLILLLPLVWGTFRLAGSARTDEMIVALRTKHQLDRHSRHFAAMFEEMRGEFDQVETFSQWWEACCSAASRLDFGGLELTIDLIDGRRRHLRWTHGDAALATSKCIETVLPIDAQSGVDAKAELTVRVSAVRSTETVAQRLSLISRLVTDCSLADARRRERKLRIADQLFQTNGETDRLPEELGKFGNLRIAVVHDFLYTYAGAEKVLEQILQLLPNAEVFALFNFLSETDRAFLRGRVVRTTFLQSLPMVQRKHRAFLPLMPLAIEQLDVSGFDLVISSSYLAAKGVITGPDQTHVCYCHSPARYVWDLQHQYLNQTGLGFGPRGLVARSILHYLRNWDARSSMGVDHFMANSCFVAKRIGKLYRRTASIVHPPVEVDAFSLNAEPREEFYLTASRLVPYKNVDAIVRAFAETPRRRLVVIGDGPERPRIEALAAAAPNVDVMGYQPTVELIDHMRRAKAFVFAAEEDFGILPVEALACGTPVIAYGRGGVTESVRDGIDGIFFGDQTPRSIRQAVDRFEARQQCDPFDPRVLHAQANRFSSQRFRQQFTDVLASVLATAASATRPGDGDRPRGRDDAPLTTRVRPPESTAATGDRNR